MKMRKLFFLLAVLLPLLAANGEDAVPDEIVAYFRNQPISVETLKSAGAANLEGLSREQDRSGFDSAIRESVISYCTKIILNEFFEKNQINVGKEAVEKYIAQRDKSLQSKLKNFVDDPAFQEKCAIHLLLEKLLPPEELEPKQNEIENFYYANQLKFRLPINERFSIIAISKDSPDAAEKADDARARLLQGENFDRVAASVDPEGAQKLIPDEYMPELKDIASSMPDNSISEVKTLGNMLVIIKMQHKTQAKIAPLAEVKAEIVEELTAKLDAIALEKLIAPALSEIRFVR